jgi:hypothetical protein
MVSHTGRSTRGICQFDRLCHLPEIVEKTDKSFTNAFATCKSPTNMRGHFSSSAGSGPTIRTASNLGNGQRDEFELWSHINQVAANMRAWFTVSEYENSFIKISLQLIF